MGESGRTGATVSEGTAKPREANKEGGQIGILDRILQSKTADGAAGEPSAAKDTAAMGSLGRQTRSRKANCWMGTNDSLGSCAEGSSEAEGNSLPGAAPQTSESPSPVGRCITTGGLTKNPDQNQRVEGLTWRG